MLETIKTSPPTTSHIKLQFKYDIPDPWFIPLSPPFSQVDWSILDVALGGRPDLQNLEIELTDIVAPGMDKLVRLVETSLPRLKSRNILDVRRTGECAFSISSPQDATEVLR